MIILEGSDCCGKTTAARILVERLGHPWVYDHMGRPPQGFDHFADYARNAGRDIVQDRYHLGALVWGNVVRNREQPMTPRLLLGVSRFLSWCGDFVVILYSSDDSWLGQRVAKDERRDHLYGVEGAVLGNRVYRSLARDGLMGEAVCDASFDVAGGNYPNDEVIKRWARMAGVIVSRRTG